LRATLLLVSGRADEALDAATRCLELSPLATNCAYLRGDIFARRGQCDLLEAESRRAVAADPRSPMAYHFLAQALAARGAPIESIRLTLRRQADLNDDESTRRAEGYLAERRLALYAGDLSTAIAREIDFEQVWEADDPSESRRNELVLFTLYDEVGESVKNVALAEKYLKHLPALTAQPTGNRAAVLDALRRAGRMTQAEYVAKRSAWIDETRAMLPPISQGTAWTFFYAYPARTEGDAREALEALPRFEPLAGDVEWGSPACDEERIGNVYLRAGRLDEATDHLRVAAGSCRILACMVPHLRAEEELAEALAQKGDTTGACSALQGVLETWGHAKPRSVTVERAREQARRLGCGR
jgi:serine/threonine-protein kinase